MGRVVVLFSLLLAVLKLLYAENMGVSRMKSVARSYVWWSSIDDHLDRLTKNCSQCL